jgi:hypothetical protein
MHKLKNQSSKISLDRKLSFEAKESYENRESINEGFQRNQSSVSNNRF